MTATPTIPQRPSDIDKSWVSTLFKNCGIESAIDEIDVAPIGTGQMATSLRVRVTYDELTDDAVESFVVKLASVDPNSREAGARGAYLKEVRYYEQLDATVSVATPQCLWSAIDVASNSFVLALEDMSPAEQGDQIKGCSVKDAAQAAANIAGLHAPRWCDDSLFELEWLTAPPTDRGAVGQEAQGIMQMLTPLFIDRYRGRIDDAHVELLNWFAGHTAEWLEQGIERFALTHADHRLDNLLFAQSASADTPSAQPVTVVDWQTIGVRNPLADISYLLGTGLEPEVRLAHEREIVGTYHDRLVGLGVTDYSFDRCFDDYREQSPHVLLITVLGSMMTGQTERGDDMFMAMLNRGCQQILDLDIA